METNLVHQLTATFEGHAQQTENGVEYWLARDLQQLLGYAEWRNFHQTAISKAKTACEVSGHRTADHFVDVNKMVETGSGPYSRPWENGLSRRSSSPKGAKHTSPGQRPGSMAPTSSSPEGATHSQNP